MSPSPPSPSRARPPGLARSATATPDDAAKAEALAESAVFDDLGAFAAAAPQSFAPPDADADSPDVGMQNMILDLAPAGDDARFGGASSDQFGAVPAGSADGSDPRFGSVPDQDWAFDTGLTVPDFLSTEMDPAAFASLPVNFMDPSALVAAPVPAPPPPTPHVSVPSNHHVAPAAHTLLTPQQVHSSLRDFPGAAATVVPPVESKHPSVQKHEPAFVPAAWPPRAQTAAPSASPQSASAGEMHDTSARRGLTGRLRSPASSASSAPGKSRVPTAVCPVCGKLISANGANFRRHVEACRRQHATKAGSPSSAPPSAPLPAPAPSPAASVWGSATGLDDFAPGGAFAVTSTHRRDQDLFGAVQRLERSISSLDMNARLCLRDALVSLSNKALNPQAAPTPEQEALNRAAEYLVLRMLFISGQQVLHSAPGTVGPVELAPAAGGDGRIPQADDGGDGTVAASTGSGRKMESVRIGDVDVLGDGGGVGKTEDKLGGP